MKQSNCKRWLVAAVSAGILIATGAAFASIPNTNIVTGTVTGVEANQITVDGKTYSVDVQGSALQALAQLHAGDQVKLVLNGPPGSSGAQVEAIQVRSGH